MKKISVIGFGKIGQAIAANILKHGFDVIAVDTDIHIQKLFKDGEYTTKEPGLTDLMNEAYKQNRLNITNDFLAVKGTDAVIVSIPLIVDNQKRLLQEPFLDTFTKLAPFLEYNLPVIIETSMPVGFGRNSVMPAIESKGKKHGVDFLLAHSPERIKSGTMMEQLQQIPKVIGGINEEAANRAYSVYQLFFDNKLLHIVESMEAAEMIKLAGMIYRDINIALSNQLAQFADAKGISFADLIPLINTDKEADLLYPGIGVGGHCTPVYPYFLIENFKEAGLDFSLAAQSRRINDKMTEYAVSLIKDKVKNKTALILGLSFRPNVKEDALSIAYLLKEVLLQNGFDIALHDTEFSVEEIKTKGFEAVTDIYDTNAEVIFLVTMHKEYQQIDFKKLYSAGARFFIDGRNNIDKSKAENAGIQYHGIGR